MSHKSKYSDVYFQTWIVAAVYMHLWTSFIWISRIILPILNISRAIVPERGRGATGRFVFCMVVLCISCLISIYMYVLGYGYIHLAEVVKSMEYSVTFPAKTSHTRKWAFVARGKAK